MEREHKTKETGDHGICTSHHLAPIFEEAFEVNNRESGKDKRFMRMVKRIDKKGLVVLDEGKI
jgi:hypothetical protein